MLLDGALREEQRPRDRRVVLALGHVREDLALAFRERRERGVGHPVLRGDERLDDLGVQDAPAARDLVQRAHELLDVGDPLLQEVAEPFGAVLEELVGVLLVGEPAEDEDADRRMLLADPFRRADALVGPGRRHPDVGHDHVGLAGLDRGHQLVVGAGRGRHLDVRLVVEELHHALPDQQVVVRDHHPQRHQGRRLVPGPVSANVVRFQRKYVRGARACMR